MLSLSPSTQLPDWSASSRFLAEVYDEQQLLQQREMLLRRRQELRKEREKMKMKQEQREHAFPRPASESTQHSSPSLVSDETNPLIPRPVIDESEEERRPAVPHDQSGRRVSPSGGSGVPYIAADMVSNERDVSAIPASSYESYQRRQQPRQQEKSHPDLRRESEQSPDAIHLHYFSRVRQ